MYRKFVIRWDQNLEVTYYCLSPTVVEYQQVQYNNLQANVIALISVIFDYLINHFYYRLCVTPSPAEVKSLRFAPPFIDINFIEARTYGYCVPRLLCGVKSLSHYVDEMYNHGLIL